jgi:hypothetical protein
MKPLDPDLESLLREWVGKADADLEAAEKLAPSVATSIRLREIVGFHCQQSVEKYLKVLLTLSSRVPQNSRDRPVAGAREQSKS